LHAREARERERETKERERDERKRERYTPGAKGEGRGGACPP